MEQCTVDGYVNMVSRRCEIKEQKMKEDKAR